MKSHLSAQNDWSDPAADRIEAHRREAVAAFATVAERLRLVHAASNKMVAALNALAALCGESDGSDPLTPLRDGMGALLIAVRDLGGEEQRRSLKADVARARSSLDDLRRQGQQLSGVSSLTALAAKSMGVEGLDDYVASLRDSSSTLRDGAVGVAVGLDEILGSQQSAAAEADKATALLEGTIGAIDAGEAARRDQTAREREERRRIEALSLKAGASMKAGVKALVAGIQFSDEFSQRMEHIVEIIGRSAETPALVGLAAAQLRALAEDTEHAVDASLAALSEIAGAAETAAREQAAAMEHGGAADLVATRRETFSAVQKTIAQIAPALDMARASLAAVRERVAAALLRFRKLDAEAALLNLSAINATLLTWRTGSARAAFSVLAGSVRETAHETERLVAACRDSFGAIERTMNEADPAAVDEAAARLRAEAAAFERIGATLEGELSSIRASSQETIAAHQAVSGSVQAAKAALETVRRLGRQIGDAAELLATTDDPGAVPEALRAELLALYTMSRERDVQARHFGDREQGGAARQDLDSVFF